MVLYRESVTIYSLNMEVNVEAGCSSMTNSSIHEEINEVPKDRDGRDQFVTNFTKTPKLKWVAK